MFLYVFGLFDIPDNFNDAEDSADDDDNDSDLEAELMAITSGNETKPKRPIRKKVPEPVVNLDAMVTESLRDIPSDEEVSDNEDDPELLNELSTITQIESEEEKEPETEESVKKSDTTASLLEERIKMYMVAEENAKKANESSRARRFNRGIKTLKDLLKQAKAGKLIKEEDIPPVVSVSTGLKPIVTAVESVTNDDNQQPEQNSLIKSSEDDSAAVSEDTSNNEEKEKLLKFLNQRKSEYKEAALQAKKSGNSVIAVKYIKICKQFDVVINAVENDQPVDLTKMPGPPSVDNENINRSSKEENEIQQSSENQNPINPSPEISENVDDDVPQLISANSVAEALEQHLQKYKSVEQQAKEEGNTSKARRIGRIIKQYEQAIKLNKAGKPFPVEELPTPPGYAPIPGENKTDPPKQTVNIPKSEENESSSLPEKPKPLPKKTNNTNQDDDSVSKTTGSFRKTGNQTSTSFNEKQLAFLLVRQKEFKEAAINAKKKGEINQAKEFLRTAKGFEPLIEAAKCGLPVDMTTVPIPPSARSELEDGFDIVMAAECVEDDSGVFDILSRLEEQLTKQLKMCMSTRDHHKALGDVAGTNRFEQLALSVTRDLDIIRITKKTGNISNPPQYHYEEKNFSIVKSFTDLNDDELELEIVRGINYRCNNPKEIDTYVKFEFPFPQEEPFREKTDLIKDTNNPEYNAKYLIPIQRKSRPCLRVFKRHGVKFEVYSRGCTSPCCSTTWDCCYSGFFRSDSLLGTITVKLQPLETVCELHESFDLLDGRKSVGGKLEIKIRIRNPLLTKQVEQLSEKWLVIDH